MDTVWILLVVIGGVLAVLAIGGGIGLWLPARHDIGQRAELGTSLIGGGVVALAFLFIQIYIDQKRQHDDAAASLRLQLGVDDSLDGIDLSKKHLERVYLVGKSMANAQMAGARLDEANLSEADLTGAGLSGARLRCANLDQAHLDNAIFQGAELVDAELVGANGSGAVFIDADLRRADFSQAVLPYASFIGSDLTDADLTDADLSSADLSNATLTGVYNDTSTKWPKDPAKRPVVLPPPRAHTDDEQSRC